MEQGTDQGVGARIKRLRKEREWGMAKLAVEADMSVSGVSMIENGKRNLTTTTLAKLARAFGVEVRDLFPLEQAPLPDFEDERREAVYGPWLEFVNRYADRWERRIEAGDFDLGSFDEIRRVFEEIEPVLLKLNARELREFPATVPDTFGGREAITGRAIWRLLDLLTPMIDAGATQFANSELERTRSKHEKVEHLRKAANG